MNSCCTQYYTIPTNAEPVILTECEETSDTCSCHCGYILYESLAPYLTKLTNNSIKDEDYIELETKLRQQIIEISRLFDVETKASPGTYSKSHYKVITIYGDGTRYLKIPEFIPSTLELYTSDGYLINPQSYDYIDGYLVLNPCENHGSTCGCSSNCGIYEKRVGPPGWNGCFQAKAKFGKECSDYAVQLAVRSYIIEYNTYGDVKETNFQGLPISRGFRLPHSWTTTVQKYLENKRSFNAFTFA